MSISVDNSAIKRIEEQRLAKGKGSLLLRITVEGGGCSGFQYKMELTEEVKDKDITFDDAVVTDDISLPFIDGATIKFKDDLIGSEFIIDNPNAQSGCGCGTSFSI
ncbi:MAG: iron-sulfur cluster assembly accessory protein [Micavibrio sp.]|nr:iron-sulfur cluster assembly accessory protein [Micavibrio sp.]